MRVRFADSTGCPVPQLVVESEDERDRMLLKSIAVLVDREPKR